MNRFKLKIGTVSVHRTKDEASPAVQKMRQVGAFPAGHAVLCECQASEGKVKPEDCSYLCVYDSDGDEVARFTGRQFRAAQDRDGSINVYAMPRSTQDRARRNELARLNARHTKFWQRMDAE
ncbi:MAG TPA: hypothetical protein VMU61_09330 [Candidatus Aquilonibacter sp.]|nr:hypothetical protein [Candidatus Aquilonibacter sp.]